MTIQCNAGRVIRSIIKCGSGQASVYLGAPGIGKSALVEQFVQSVVFPCVSLLGSQLAPEDIIGIPQIKDGTSEFLLPKMNYRRSGL